MLHFIQNYRIYFDINGREKRKRKQTNNGVHDALGWGFNDDLRTYIFSKVLQWSLEEKKSEKYIQNIYDLEAVIALSKE